MFDLFIRYVLTIVGTVSLVSIFKFLNITFGVSYFYFFLLALIVPSIYSVVINIFLEGLDNKIEAIKKDVDALESELDKSYQQDKDIIIKNIEIRFGELSNDRKVKLLNYIKTNMVNDASCDYISKLENEKVLVLLADMDESIEEGSVYSRKRKFNDK